MYNGESVRAIFVRAMQKGIRTDFPKNAGGAALQRGNRKEGFTRARAVCRGNERTHYAGDDGGETPTGGGMEACEGAAARRTIFACRGGYGSKITLWRVQYDDGDLSDYNIAEIAPLLKKIAPLLHHTRKNAKQKAKNTKS